MAVAPYKKRTKHKPAKSTNDKITEKQLAQLVKLTRRPAWRFSKLTKGQAQIELYDAMRKPGTAKNKTQ